MDYIKAILSGLAAIFVAELAFLWPILNSSKATGLAVLLLLLSSAAVAERSPE
jgi:hypothetical protein